MQLHEALSQIDGLLDHVSSLITQNNPDLTQQAVQQLRDALAAFAQVSQRFKPEQYTPANVQHMQRISERIGLMRGHISKMGAITAQQLAALMPQQSNPHTYGHSALGGQAQPGNTASVARLYHVSS